MLPPRTHASGAGKRKTARTSGAVMLCRGDFLSGICSRASSLAAQSTVASPARLLDPVVSESLLMQVPIIAKTPFPVKSFFEHFETISMPPPLSCRCALTSTSCGAVLQLLRRHNSRRILCERLLIVGQRKRWTRTPRAAHRVSQASLSVAGSP